MRKLGERLAQLEAANLSGTLSIVWMDDGQTEGDAVAAYGRSRIGAGDEIMFVSWEGGCDGAVA